MADPPGLMVLGLVLGPLGGFLLASDALTSKRQAILQNAVHRVQTFKEDPWLLATAPPIVLVLPFVAMLLSMLAYGQTYVEANEPLGYSSIHSWMILVGVNIFGLGMLVLLLVPSALSIRRDEKIPLSAKVLAIPALFILVPLSILGAFPVALVFIFVYAGVWIVWKFTALIGFEQHARGIGAGLLVLGSLIEFVAILL